MLCTAIALSITDEAKAQTYEAELDAAIAYYFPAHAEDDAEYIVECESGSGDDLYNEWSGAAGPWQFMAETSYGLGFDHGAMYDPWYSTWAAYEYWKIAGWSPWACSY